MNQSKVLAVALITATLCGCSTLAKQQHSPATLAESSTSMQAQGGTTLLVSLDDGSIIKQVIDVGADICFKQNSASSTTCFSQGNAIIDPVTENIVAYEMIEAHIELISTSN